MKIQLALAAAFVEKERAGFGTEISNLHGHICVLTGGKYSPCKHSVTEFVVDEDKRGKGHGVELVKEVIKRYHSDIGAQVSSPASVVAFYKCGFRPAMKQQCTQPEALKLFKEEWGSILMVYKPAQSFED
jgi:GNAT superfamily N-acetyltransferase